MIFFLDVNEEECFTIDANEEEGSTLDANEEEGSTIDANEEEEFVPEEKRVSCSDPEKVLPLLDGGYDYVEEAGGVYSKEEIHDEQESMDASKIDLKRSFDESNITNSEESFFIL